jgi:putative NIF3 family GTP cyclohydrolase 1 type 2
LAESSLQEITGALDEYLEIGTVPDDTNALNGLQVENSGRVTRVAVAVDASADHGEAVRRGATCWSCTTACSGTATSR